MGAPGFFQKSPFASMEANGDSEQFDLARSNFQKFQLDHK